MVSPSDCGLTHSWITVGCNGTNISREHGRNRIAAAQGGASSAASPDGVPPRAASCCLHLVAEYFADIQFVQFTGESLQCGERAASITVWIRQRATVALFESLHGVAQPFEFVEGCLKLQVCHLSFLTLREASLDIRQRGMSQSVNNGIADGGKFPKRSSAVVNNNLASVSVSD